MTSTEMRAFMTALEVSGNNGKILVKAANINRTRYQLFRMERVELTSGEIAALEAVLIDAGLLEAEEE